MSLTAASFLPNATQTKYGHTLCLQPEDDKCRTMIFFEFKLYSMDTRAQVEALQNPQTRIQTENMSSTFDLSGSLLDRRIVSALQQKDQLIFAPCSLLTFWRIHVFSIVINRVIRSWLTKFLAQQVSLKEHKRDSPNRTRLIEGKVSGTSSALWRQSGASRQSMRT